MKQSYVIAFGIVALLTVGYIFISRCFQYFLWKGQDGYSETIEESKRSGLFEASYRVRKHKLFMPQISLPTIGDVWLEHSWSYGNCWNPVIVKKSAATTNQFLLKIEYRQIDSMTAQLGNDWAIRTTDGETSGTYGVRETLRWFIPDTKKIPPLSKELVVIARNPLLSDNEPWWNHPMVVGIFVLEKNP